MRIAFLNRGREAFPGGDCIQLDATMDALRQRGHFVEETGWDRDRMRAGNFDIAHIMHANFSWSWGNYEAVRDVGLPYVLTPIYYPGPLLSGITRQQLEAIINNAKAVLPFSQKESEEMYGEIGGIDRKAFFAKHRSIPNGADAAFSSPDGRGHMPVLDVLCVSARGDSDKGIPAVREMCQRLNYSFTAATDISRSDLAEIYRHHRVFINASGSERMSLTIGEALCAGCRVLATDQNRANAWYPGLVTFDPSDSVKLEHLIRWSLSSGQWDYRPNSAARCLTWKWVAEKIESVYREVLGAL